MPCYLFIREVHSKFFSIPVNVCDVTSSVNACIQAYILVMAHYWTNYDQSSCGIGYIKTNVTNPFLNRIDYGSGPFKIHIGPVLVSAMAQ